MFYFPANLNQKRWKQETWGHVLADVKCAWRGHNILKNSLCVFKCDIDIDIYIYIYIYIYKIPRMQCLTLPNFTTAAAHGATIYDQENSWLVNHEDSDVPQQCARARSLFFYEWNEEMNLLFGSRMTFSKDYKMKIIYFAQ